MEIEWMAVWIVVKVGDECVLRENAAEELLGFLDF
jgi:hypothetical protein